MQHKKTADDEAPFELTDLQQSYYVGRQSGISLGGVPTHIYCELESRKFDEKRFVNAMNIIISRHDILRCVFDDMGKQHILKKVTLDSVPFKDISGEENKDEVLAELRIRINNKIRSIDRAPLIYPHVIKYAEDRYITGIYFDSLIIDG